MGIPQFNDVTSLSNNEISEAIIRTEKELFTLRFKKFIRIKNKGLRIKRIINEIINLK